MSDCDKIQKCLVTGAAGFIGRPLVHALLQQNFFVRVLSRRDIAMPAGVDVVVGDLSHETFDFNALVEGVDTVFHLAATAHSAMPASCYERDCSITLRLAHKAQTAGVKRFVFVSSTRAMAAPGANKVDESWMAWPDDAYGYWKRMAEQRFLDEISIPQMVILRPCLVYGAGVKGNLRRMIDAISRGFFPPLPPLPVERSMVAVDDLVRAILLTAQHPQAHRQPLLIADGQPYTPFVLYSAIQQALGKKVPGWHVPMSVLNCAGFMGDALQRVWPGCPLSRELIARLTEPCAFSADRLWQLGWVPRSTFYDLLPGMLSGVGKKPCR